MVGLGLSFKNSGLYLDRKIYDNPLNSDKFLVALVFSVNFKKYWLLVLWTLRVFWTFFLMLAVMQLCFSSVMMIQKSLGVCFGRIAQWP